MSIDHQEQEVAVPKRMVPPWLLYSLLTILLWGVWGATSKAVANDINAYMNQVLLTIGLVPVLFPLWLFFALATLIFWGTTGVTQKLSTNAISTELSFLWFVLAFLPIALVIVLAVPLDWHLKMRVYCLAVVGGALNGLGALT